ncbi:MAG: hypothetical protein K8R21_06285 [Leptospira sp.]|nr:hypothetical protein [Leptospira sp.]
MERQAIRESTSLENLMKLIDKAISRQAGISDGESEVDSIKIRLKRPLMEL